MPLKNYDAVGLFAQSIWKYLFQKTIERRDDPNDSSRRPVFLWIDEAQYFHSASPAPGSQTTPSFNAAEVAPSNDVRATLTAQIANLAAIKAQMEAAEKSSTRKRGKSQR